MKNLLNKKAVPQDANYTVVALTEEGKVIVKGGSEPTFEYVDLGLPSGLKWATCNVGATNPEEYGLYFQWGDTVGYEGDEAKAHSSWKTAPFNNGSSSYNKTYFASVSGSVCPNGILAEEYDAAHVHMGGDWRMPTEDEIRELKNETVTSSTQVNGIDCIKYSSKTDSSKHIVFPKAGYYNDGYISGNKLEFRFWSTKLDLTYTNNARFCYSTYGPNSIDRHFALCVRGVRN